MRKIILVLLAIVMIARVMNAQDKSFNHFDIGIGMGVNYGGFGWSVAYAPMPFVSIEGSFGYNIVEPAGGVAINVYVIPKNNTKLYSMAIKSMYGFNAAIIAPDDNVESKSFYGLSFGLSNELRFGSRKRSGINLDLIVPLRSKEIDEYLDELEINGYSRNDFYPITISIGYHFEF